ncbi:metallophosphoesterase family protein [Picrophilus oshimae]|uniref:DNA double-strand break repair protein Mre11 n=1 Tax=Picrophilus torridus (strain ATCC 700027 / DSM 9790 / JCM 10055 / NBRC 100828 / KAW 2/3) TaxID=1122961 RepID=A0A8G2L807_PICTO|nr:exonuclease SbcCD subunit D [Picrophilus oshimae]SMD31585.1 DNA repair exonuclease SbcCD nuclease subunit [Picrophilus oshimae DSM 9789]
MVRFIHFSDTHLGYKQYMMDERENDFYEAFNEAIDIGINEHVDFFVHSGDLFDTWLPSNRAMNEFKKAMLKLYERNIDMYLIMGDHDRPKRRDEVASRIFDFLGVHLLGYDDLDVVRKKFDEEIIISGISNMKGLRIPQLLELYKKADVIAESEKNSVLISHEGVSPYFIKEQSEVDSSDLPVNYTYLAFGHIHDSKLIDNKKPVFSYAGSTEINDTNELNHFKKYGKSVNLVDINSGTASVSRIKLNSTRYQDLIKTDNINLIIDLDKSLENATGIKKPLITLIINTEDKEYSRKVLAMYNQKAEIRCLFNKSVNMPENPVKSERKLIDYFHGYFHDDKKAELAYNIYTSIKNESVDDAYEIIKKMLLR